MYLPVSPKHNRASNLVESLDFGFFYVMKRFKLSQLKKKK